MLVLGAVVGVVGTGCELTDTELRFERITEHGVIYDYGSDFAFIGDSGSSYRLAELPLAFQRDSVAVILSGVLDRAGGRDTCMCGNLLVVARVEFIE